MACTNLELRSFCDCGCNCGGVSVDMTLGASGLDSLCVLDPSNNRFCADDGATVIIAGCGYADNIIGAGYATLTP